jgi:tripartite-type tricarboxylate transporter receptor subunit TctC
MKTYKALLKTLRVALVVSAGIGLASVSGQALAQNFPNQTVRLISPFPPGSGPDVVARIVGERMGAAWKQPMVVDSRPGANGFIAMNAVKAAAPTGYDLVMADVGHMAVGPSLFKKLPYDPKADYVPVGGLYSVAFFVMVGANSPYQNVKELLAAAAASPGKISYGSNSIGGPLHLGAAQLEAAANTKMLHVPYKETSQLYIAVSNGEVDWAVGSLASAGPMLKAGKVRVLAVGDSVRSVVMPAVPTLVEAGGPSGVTMRAWVGIFAPKGTPPAVITTLNKNLNDALTQTEVVEKLAGFGFVPFATSSAAMAALIDTETVFYADMVRRTGASAE